MARSVMALYRADRNNNNNNIEEANEVLARFVPRQRGRSSRETQRAPYFAREREQRLAFFLDGGKIEGGDGNRLPTGNPSLPRASAFRSLRCSRVSREFLFPARIQRSCPRCYSGRPRSGIQSPNDDVTGARLFPSPDCITASSFFPLDPCGTKSGERHRRTTDVLTRARATVLNGIIAIKVVAFPRGRRVRAPASYRRRTNDLN